MANVSGSPSGIRGQAGSRREAESQSEDKAGHSPHGLCSAGAALGPGARGPRQGKESPPPSEALWAPPAAWCPSPRPSPRPRPAGAAPRPAAARARTHQRRSRLAGLPRRAGDPLEPAQGPHTMNPAPPLPECPQEGPVCHPHRTDPSHPRRRRWRHPRVLSPPLHARHSRPQSPRAPSRPGMHTGAGAQKGGPIPGLAGHPLHQSPRTGRGGVPAKTVKQRVLESGDPPPPPRPRR